MFLKGNRRSVERIVLYCFLFRLIHSRPCEYAVLTGTPFHICGFDVAQTSAHRMRPATLNCHVGATLLLRSLAAKEPKARSEARALLDHTVNGLQAATVEHIAAVAWHLDEKSTDIQGLTRTPCDKIQVKLVEESQFEETSDLQTLIEEDHHRGLQRGTKRAILSGAGAFSGNLTQQRNDPHLHLGPLSWILFAHGGFALWEKSTLCCQTRNYRQICNRMCFLVTGTWRRRDLLVYQRV